MLKEWNVYELIDALKGHKVMHNCLIFNIKSDDHKCTCLVVKGFSQVKGIDFDHICCPIVRFEVMYLMLALASLENWHIKGLDIQAPIYIAS